MKSTPWEQATRTLLLIASCYKNPAFRHEEEARIVVWLVRVRIPVNLILDSAPK
jgi:hypothetical protein